MPQKTHVRLLILGFLFLPVLIRMTQASTPVFPLKEIKPGLRGECHTVFSGTKVQSFQFEVMGIGRDFAGPGHDVIWCKMISDPTGQMVVAAGMSGSPCFIQGRNIGAMAFGWSFNKDPVFGVQPIESMLEVLDFEGNERKSSRIHLSSSARQDGGFRPSSTMPPFLKSMAGFIRPLPIFSSDTAAQLIPLPLEVSGLNPLIADRVLKSFSEAGFFPQMAAGGGFSKMADAADLVPGAALTGVISRGDLNIAATGTLTWRDGNQILAFGHPFLGTGSANIPFGKAEIIGVVSSYERSMKMSNKGSIVGTLTQDRMSAVSGMIGPVPKLVQMVVNIQRPDLRKTYKLEFCDNQYFTPLVYQTALLQFLASVMERTDEATLKLETEIQLEGLPSLRFQDRFAGERFTWVLDAVILSSMQLIPIYQNDFGTPAIRSISVRADIAPMLHSTSLVDMAVEPLEISAGGTVRVRAGFQSWHGKRSYQEYEIKLPEEVKAGELELILADAHRMNQLMGVSGNLMAFSGLLSSKKEPRDLKQLISVLNERNRNDHLYLVLQKKSEGLYVQNQRLTALPESVRKLLAADQPADGPPAIHDIILSKTEIDFGSVVKGSQGIKIRVK